MKNVDLKPEAFRLATLVMCQSATASKGEEKPTTEEVLAFSKVIHKWFSEGIE